MDSAREQMHRWAAWRFDDSFENIKCVDFDSTTRLVGCETCGDYETEHEVMVHFNNGRRAEWLDFSSVYALISELTQDIPDA